MLWTTSGRHHGGQMSTALIVDGSMDGHFRVVPAPAGFTDLPTSVRVAMVHRLAVIRKVSARQF
jgi:hypothetical protein